MIRPEPARLPSDGKPPPSECRRGSPPSPTGEEGEEEVFTAHFFYLKY